MEHMCATGSIALFLAIVVIAATFLILYVVGSSLIWKFAPVSSRADCRKAWLVASFVLSIIAPFAIGSIASHHQQIEEDNEQLRRHTEFWQFFSVNAPQLYSASSDDDPAVQKLSAYLGENWKDYTFKLGPIHDGRREFALASRQYHMWQDGTTLGSLVEVSPLALRKQWYIGTGFAQARQPTYDYSIKPNLLIRARRNQGGIDVDLYGEGSLGQQLMTFSSCAKERLGEEVYYRLLGKINAHKLSQAPPNLPLSNDIKTAILPLINAAERRELDSHITTKPCVVFVENDPCGQFSQKTSAIRSPYITLR